MTSLNWGIFATGGISTKFALDLLKDPKERGAGDITHHIVAVASSSGKERADKFIEENGIPETCEPYGSYQALVRNPKVQIVYIGSPHGVHFKDAKLALEAGKHVLCEKAFTINAAQARELVRIARRKNLFLMEAVWTRYFPIVKDLQKKLFEDRVIGKINRMTVDNSIDFDVDNMDPEHRILDPKKGGGALLDCGIYCLTWVFLTCYADPENKQRAPTVKSHIITNKATGVDETTTMVLHFPGNDSLATATSSLRDSTPHQDHSIRIIGDKGYVVVHGPAYRPTGFTVYAKKEKPKTYEAEALDGTWLFYEADEAAKCIQDGKLESGGLPLDESVLIMEVMDEVRKQNGFKYPDDIESL